MGLSDLPVVGAEGRAAKSKAELLAERIVSELDKDRTEKAQERKTRKHVDRRDQRQCFWPGCKVYATDKHHQIPRSKGGQWTPENIISGCRRHHDWFKAQLIRVYGNAEKKTLTIELTDLGKKAKIRLPRKER